MKKIINRKIRKILFWLLKNRIKGFAISKVLSGEEMVTSKMGMVDYIKREMAHEIAMKLLEDGAIDIEEEDFPQFNGRRYIMRLYVLPPKNHR